MKLFLASAAFRSYRFDLMATVDAAAEHAFDGVQLFVNESHLSRSRDLIEVSERAFQTGLDVIVHLPDRSYPEIPTALMHLLANQGEKRAVVHFFADEAVPDLPRVALGLENAPLGYDEDYYRRLFNAVQSRGLFLAFDIPRLFSVPPKELELVRGFAEETLNGLTARDVIHLIDLASCNGSRSNWCPLGEGIMSAFMPAIARFPGVVVLEFEDFQQSLQSRSNLLQYAE